MECKMEEQKNNTKAKLFINHMAKRPVFFSQMNYLNQTLFLVRQNLCMVHLFFHSLPVNIITYSVYSVSWQSSPTQNPTNNNKHKIPKNILHFSLGLNLPIYEKKTHTHKK